ncbi:MAG: serine/threonine protein kinase [Myxococcales bacterium]|nr:serine/threonine protein kinase [Myxococcales bacterium]
MEHSSTTAEGLVSAARRSEEAFEVTVAAPSRADARADDELRGRVGRYVMIERVGAGAMGVVYSAYDPELDRKVAIKLLQPGSDDEALQLRLVREAQAMARLSHPNVVHVHDVGRHSDRVFIAMEFVRGRSLGSWLRLAVAPRPWRETLELFVQAGRGLRAAHDVGLVHRDFKPDNILIDDLGTPKVTDFGLARSADASASPGADAATRVTAREPVEPVELEELALTRTGALVGTPAYMAPEQHLGETADARSDQFSYCVSLYEALYGARPFTGDTVYETVDAVLSGQVASPPRSAAVPRWLRQVVLRGLARAPEERWPSMGALLEALTRGRRAPRWPWLAAAGVIAAGVGVGVALSLQARAVESACEAEAAAFGRVWSDARADAIERVFTATGGALRRGHVDARGRINDYGQAWGARWRASCPRARPCWRCAARALGRFRRARSQLSRSPARGVSGALLEVFEQADEAVVRRAISATEALTPVFMCSEEQVAKNLIVGEGDAAQAEALTPRGASSRVHAARLAGRSGDAERACAALVARSAALGVPSLVAESSLEHGTLLRDMGRHEDAERALLEAWWAAVGCGHDVVAFDAALELVTLVGSALSRPEEGLVWHGNAEAVLNRVGGGDEARARLALRRANLELERARYVEARALFELALELSGRARGESDLTVATALAGLGRVQVALGDLDAAVRSHARAIEVRVAQLGPAHPLLARSHYNFAKALLTSGRAASAAAHFREALAIKQRAFGPDAPALAGDLLALGTTLMDQLEYDEALAHFERALELETSRGRDTKLAGSVHSNIGELLRRRGELAAARTHLTHALELRERTLDPDDPRVAYPLLSIARVDLAESAYDDAHARLSRALELRERGLGANNFRVAAPLCLLAQVHQARGELARARAALERALPLLEPVDGERQQLGECRFTMARQLAAERAPPAEVEATAQSALAAYADASENTEEARAEVARWLAARAGEGE